MHVTTDQLHEAETRPRRQRPPPSIWATRGGRLLLGSAGMLVLATVLGLVVLWPHGDNRTARTTTPTVHATVASISTPSCGGQTNQLCLVARIRVDEGADKGRTFPMSLGPVDLLPAFSVGQGLRVQKPTVDAEAQVPEPYVYAGLDRRTPLIWLAVIAAALAVVLLRLRGLLAVLGLALSLLLIATFLLPAITAGGPTILIALVAAMAVTIVTLVLTSGIGPQTMAAFIGIALTLLPAAAAAALVADLAHLDGRASDVAGILQQVGDGISLQSVVVAGVVLGALGALTDTAVTQASAVMALRRANPALGVRALYREGFTVGRDHLAATVHTLVLAYVGAALPLLLAMHASRTATADAFSSQDLAEPVAATLVGTLALLACVPVTTALAAALAARVPSRALPDAHAHAH